MLSHYYMRASEKLHSTKVADPPPGVLGRRVIRNEVCIITTSSEPNAVEAARRLRRHKTDRFSQPYPLRSGDRS